MVGYRLAESVTYLNLILTFPLELLIVIVSLNVKMHMQHASMSSKAEDLLRHRVHRPRRWSLLQLRR